ncbi:DUF4252 domain-containing protein [Flavobacterium sp.]|uniref:DUF4252 domain-containing protein n=1 Tax=Flavobacterium sp. TaxID=239 RepID=UPI002B4B382B|nr:DUF4252 domain-containing protein [Flavobacterium sp.]HLP63821.1 DUF4252 domain-containing protein [Flavobacterium sp.]
MRYIVYLAIAASLLLVSCNSEPTLQKFFVENSEKKDFIALDVSSDILRLDETSLTSEQKQALDAFDKVNIIAFKSTDKNQKEYQAEKAKLNGILKKEEYQQLIKVGSGSQGASISFVGTEDKIDEFILYANKKENGFAVIRVTGDEMNPTHIMTMLSLLQKSNIDLEQLKPLQGLMQ